MEQQVQRETRGRKRTDRITFNSDREVRALKPPRQEPGNWRDGLTYDAHDARGGGLKIRVATPPKLYGSDGKVVLGPDGLPQSAAPHRKTFVLLTNVRKGGVVRRLKLGTYPDISLAEARELAAALRSEIQRTIREGKEWRPKPTEAPKPLLTFRALAEQYEAHLKAKNGGLGRLIEKDGRLLTPWAWMIEKELYPQWANRPAQDISGDDVRDAILAVKPRGLAYTHNLFSSLRAMYAWGRGAGLKVGKPCQDLRPTDLIGERRRRRERLNDREIYAFWIATGQMGYPFGTCLRLLLLTGTRLREIADMHRDEITGELFTVPPKRFKSRCPHPVPLSALVQSIIADIPKHAGGYLLSARAGAAPVGSFGQVKTRLVSRMLKILRDCSHRPDSVKLDFRIHDLRRVVRSNLAALRVDSDVSEAILGHYRRDLKANYQTYEHLPERADALEMWASRVLEIVASYEMMPQRRDGGDADARS